MSYLNTSVNKMECLFWVECFSFFFFFFLVLSFFFSKNVGHIQLFTVI